MDSTPAKPGEQEPSAPKSSQPVTTTALTGDAPLDVDEGLPEIEPLTPELVEDEAVRGDFMLRWSAVLLAVLLGWTEVSESLTLVRIKTGQYLAAHGWLPPRTDVFSVSAAEQPWLNFSWLGDLLLSSVYGIGGDIALTVLAAVLAGISFWCVTAVSRKGVSNWWGSICVTLAALAAFPLLRPGPDSIAILGLSLTMLLLLKAEERPDGARYILLLPLLWLWSNLDGHAFLGAAVVLAYALGDLIDARRPTIGSRGAVWVFAIGGILAMFVHPFHVHVARAPQLLYWVDPIERLQYINEGFEFNFLSLRLVDRIFWREFNVFTVAGLLTAFAALLSMALNRRHLRMSHLLTWLAMIGLALVSVHALLAAGAVFAALAAVNGQEWYRRNFRQSYSVEAAELLFSRGGRAVTVIGMFALAYFAVSGRLMGTDGRRIGMGLDPEMSATIASLQDLLTDSYDDRSFNFNPAQGDLLIWIGHKPFVDSRLAMYASAQPNLAERHRKLRLALRQRTSNDSRMGQRDEWHAAFTEFQISHALPRLSGRRPNYETFFDLMSDPEREWRLAKLGAASAAMYWYRADDQPLADYLAAHPGSDFLKLAFPRDGAEDPAPLSGIAPPREPSWYEEMLVLPKHVASNDVQLSRHYAQLRLALSGRVTQDYSAALAMLAIRHARRGLVSDPNSADAYGALSTCYVGLNQLETYLDPTRGVATGTVRARQALSALLQAARCNPDDATTQMALFQMMMNARKYDLAIAHLHEVERITGTLTLAEPTSEEGRAEIEQNREIMTQLDKQIVDVRKELQESLASEKMMESQTGRIDVVSSAINRNLPGEALRLLEEDQTIVAQNASLQLLIADLLLDVGRISEAVDRLESMSTVMLQQGPFEVSRWRNTTAYANIAAGNYERARTLLEEDAAAATEMRMQSTLGMSPKPGEQPGLSSVPLTHAFPDLLDARMISRVSIAGDLLYAYPQQWNRDQYLIAACDMEDGRNHAAAQRLTTLVERDPESELRALAVFYASSLTGNPESFSPPSQDIPVWGDMFAPDTPADANPSGNAPATDSTEPSGAATNATPTPGADAGTGPSAPPESARQEAGAAP